MKPHARPVLEMLSIAGPVVAQFACYNLLHFTDTWMLAKVGDTEAAASASAGMFTFSVISFGMGVVFLVNTLVSQCFGRGDHANCGRYLWQGIWWGLLYSVAIIPLILMGARMFSWFGHEARMAHFEAVYFQIIVSASVIRLVSTALGQTLLAIDRARVVLLAALVGVAVNVLFNWMWIYGRLGFPAMGVAGAAHATNVGSLCEMLVLAAVILRPEVRKRFGILDWKPRKAEFAALLKPGWASGLQILSEVLAWSIFGVVVIGLFKNEGMAAYQYAMRYLITGFMPCLGISTAVTALVGRYIGMGRPDLALRRAHMGFRVSAIYTITVGALTFTFREQLIGLFSHDPKVLALGTAFMALASFYYFFDAMYIVYFGALRGAADTFVPALATGILCWGIMLGGGYVVALKYPHLGIVGPWIMATVYGVLLGVFMLLRFSLGRWRTHRGTALVAEA